MKACTDFSTGIGL